MTCFVKDKKKNLENSILLLDAVAPIMEVAEKYVHYTGEEKKEFVLTKINQLAIENKLKFDEVAVSNKIEELITLSKEVNNKQQSTKEKEDEEREGTTIYC